MKDEARTNWQWSAEELKGKRILSLGHQRGKSRKKFASFFR